MDNEMNNPVKMLTILEASRLIPGLTEFRIRQMCRDGSLPSIKAGRKFLICDRVLYETICHPTPQQVKPKTVRGITPID